MRECPYCIELVNKYASICPHCRSELIPHNDYAEEGNNLRTNLRDLLFVILFGVLLAYMLLNKEWPGKLIAFTTFILEFFQR